MRKRDSVLMSDAHLVEIDLLREGRRLPTIEPLPRGDYFVLIGRGDRRPLAGVYASTLRQSLPRIPIPLQGNDADVFLGLQHLFNERYDRSGYDYTLDYSGPLVPPLSDADAEWVRQVLSSIAPD